MIDLDRLEALAKAATPTNGTYHERGHAQLGYSLDGVDEGSRGSFDRIEDTAYYAAVNPQAIQELIALARRASGWISIEERLPPLDADGNFINVLFAGRDQFGVDFLYLGFYFDDEGEWYHEDYNGRHIGPIRTVTHWQPLPPPPAATAALPTSED